MVKGPVQSWKEKDYCKDLCLRYHLNLKVEGETSAKFSNRKNRLYRKRSYFKSAVLAAKGAADTPQLEVSVPIVKDIHSHMGKLGKIVNKAPIEQWANLFQKHNLGRVVHVTKWVHHGTLPHFLYPMGGVKDPVDMTTNETVIKKNKWRK
jgi:hypothetical protein